MSVTVIPQLVQRRAEQALAAYCEAGGRRLNCPHMTLEYGREGADLVLTCRDGCNPSWRVAMFRYAPEFHQWFLYAPGEVSEWRFCHNVSPSLDLGQLLRYLDADPLRLFWPPTFTCFS